MKLLLAALSLTALITTSLCVDEVRNLTNKGHLTLILNIYSTTPATTRWIANARATGNTT